MHPFCTWQRTKTPHDGAMKANRLKWLLLLLLLVGVFQSPAQQDEADRNLLADVRTKAEKGDAQFQYALGEALKFGLFGVAKDEKEAVKWRA
jgi:TPR repeat protein